MRKQLMIFLISTICLWFISCLREMYLKNSSDRFLLDTAVGVVSAGNFTFWQLGHNGPLLIELISVAGDADLYISDGAKPSYETEAYNLSSVTCGLDVVKVPADYHRPINIGVFGHWSHSFSEYVLRVFLDMEEVITQYKKLPSELPGSWVFSIDKDPRNNLAGDLAEVVEGHRSYLYQKLNSILGILVESIIQ